jgi:UDP-N-acetylmuramate dehydrogenase
VEELQQAASLFWALGLPFMVLGGGSNLLVSDAGIRGVVVHNRARRVRFAESPAPPTVRAESGANLGALARLAASRGLAGLEWAGGIPGTVGGAVFGNAGAHSGDMAGSLLVAEILHRETPPAAEPAGAGGLAGDGTRAVRQAWPVERLGYGYRSSVLKRNVGQDAILPCRSPETIVLAATLRLERSTREAARAKMEQLVRYRRQTQPPGASMGSMFKNPPGDYAGRLIEAAGLKGTRIGAAEISRLHANFFVNLGGARATDIWALIRLARRAVAEQFNVNLELEIELAGSWAAEEFDETR